MVTTSTELIDLSQYPARVINEQSKDPAWGIAGAPPNFGKPVVPHIYTVQGRVGTISRVYRPYDEAIRHSRDNARYMRNECGIMECLEARQRGTALLKWHLAPENEDSQDQKTLCDELTKIIEVTPDFLEYRRNLLEALWYGKYANAHIWRREKVHGKRRSVIAHWEPRHGDKLVWRYDDGKRKYDPRQIGIRLGAGYEHYMDPPPQIFPGQDRPSKIEATDQGLAYFLDQWERDTLIAVHKHIIEDGAYEDPLQAGSIHGIGIRSRIYWSWYSMQEILTYMLDYLERSSLGVEIWRYPAGNVEAEKQTRKAAEERIGGGRSIILFPVPKGEDSHDFDLQHIEPGLQGVEAIRQLLTEYFGWKIKRYILGQILTSEAEATGLGSGVADAHMATFMDIIRYDAQKLSESMTYDFVRPLKDINFPAARDIKVRLVIDTESADSQEKLEGFRNAFDMGLKLKEEDVYAQIGASKPADDEDFLQNPQFAEQPGMGGAGGLPPGMTGLLGGPGSEGGPPSMGPPGSSNGGPPPSGGNGANWTSFRGPRGGIGKRNVDTGEIVYDKTFPDQFAKSCEIVGDRGGESPFTYVEEQHKVDYAAEANQEVERAAAETELNPTDAQKEAGNYRKGKCRIHGLEIAIENPKGGTRSGTRPDGSTWSIKMPAHYGYIKTTESEADGDHIDIFIGPNPSSELVHVIDQVDEKGKFDEHKVMLGWPNKEQAEAAYASAYDDGWKVGPITSMTIEQFKDWIATGDSSKPVSSSHKFERDGFKFRYFMPGEYEVVLSDDGGLTYARKKSSPGQLA